MAPYEAWTLRKVKQPLNVFLVVRLPATLSNSRRDNQSQVLEGHKRVLGTSDSRDLLYAANSTDRPLSQAYDRQLLSKTMETRNMHAILFLRRVLFDDIRAVNTQINGVAS